MARTLTARLHQLDGPKGIRLFEVFDHRFLRVRQTNGQSPLRDYAMDVAILSASGRPLHNSDQGWLWAAGAATLVLFIDLAVLLLGTGSPWLLLPLAGLLLALTVICVTQFLHSRRHLLTFVSRYAAVPLVEILAEQPEAESYSAFITTLSNDIETLASRKDLTAADLRAGELRSLRKLLEQKIITPAAYEDAKQRLLNHAD
jgi:hypothetical protein